MNQISQERVQWIDQRLRVLNGMFAELVRTRHFYGALINHVHGAADEVCRERLSLQLEREVVLKLLAEQEST
jgi:hypothetical protein